jgi:hypothetical protein
METKSPLPTFDTSGIAWEFLRRNPAYRASFATLHTCPSSDASGATQILTREASDAAALVWGLQFRGTPGHSSCRGAAVLEFNV